jgi:hypothetical protein
MFNPVIVIALIIQTLIAKKSRGTGAVVSYLITGGILVWGLGVYAQGDGILFFGVPISLPVFVGLCVFWFAMDTRELIAANKQAGMANPAPEIPAVPVREIVPTIPNPTPLQSAPSGIPGVVGTYCVVCGKEFGPHLTSHCTPNSIVAIKNDGGFTKQLTCYTLSGKMLSEADLSWLQARERATYLRDHPQMANGARV